MVIYIDENCSLNFLYLNGYKAIENHGIIPFEKIHYYDNAGDVHYVSEIQGNYTSFGGSFTGASFSKEISLIGGALFGVMGMATGAMLTYKPSKYEQPKTTFDINSETHRIDDRNVILNFFSDTKKQYIDLELPQTIYNFLQTYLPEKKYDIVMELEKNKAVNNNVYALEPPVNQSQLPSSENDPMTEFKKKVQKLKIMYEVGLLSDEELKEEKKKLLSNL